MAENPEGDDERGEDSGIEFLNSAGEWERIRSEPVRTGDPELDQLWDMELDQFRKIVEDDSHPLHSKAERVNAEMFSPIIDAANAAMLPVTRQLTDAVNNTIRAAIRKQIARTTPIREPVSHPVSGAVDAISSVNLSAEVRGITDHSTPADLSSARGALFENYLERMAVASERQADHVEAVENRRIADAPAQTRRQRRAEIISAIAALAAVGALIVSIIALVASQASSGAPCT